MTGKDVKSGSVVVDREECVGCEACLDVCPVAAISMDDEKAQIDPGQCTRCGACIEECPVEAIRRVPSGN